MIYTSTQNANEYSFYSFHENSGSLKRQASFKNSQLMNYIEDSEHRNYTMGLQKQSKINKQKGMFARDLFKTENNQRSVEINTVVQVIWQTLFLPLLAEYPCSLSIPMMTLALYIISELKRTILPS